MGEKSEAEFSSAFAALKALLERHAKGLVVQSDTDAVYSLGGRVASPFPQHKGHPMWFGSAKLGKAYVSFHLMPLYMNPALTKIVSPALKKRMQGKTCFNFKAVPEPELLKELEQLTEAAIQDWTAKGWL
jgi:hypothetical protein